MPHYISRTSTAGPLSPLLPFMTAHPYEDELNLERSFKNIRGDIMDPAPAVDAAFFTQQRAGAGAPPAPGRVHPLEQAQRRGLATHSHTVTEEPSSSGAIAIFPDEDYDVTSFHRCSGHSRRLPPSEPPSLPPSLPPSSLLPLACIYLTNLLATLVGLADIACCICCICCIGIMMLHTVACVSTAIPTHQLPSISPASLAAVSQKLLYEVASLPLPFPSSLIPGSLKVSCPRTQVLVLR